MNNVMNHPTLKVFFSGRRRFQLAWILAILLVFSANQYPNLSGTIVCAIGAALRFWSSGYLRKEASLAVGGPYRFTRNPLYLGTFLMGLGATISVGAYVLAVVMGIVFFFNYHYVILHEEEKLPAIFGNAYVQYGSVVPRFLPRLTPAPHPEMVKLNPRPEVHQFSWQLALNNKAFEAVYSFLGLMLGMALLVWVKKILFNS